MLVSQAEFRQRLRADHPRHPPGTRNVGDRLSYLAYEVTIETVAVRKAWFPDTVGSPATSSQNPNSRRGIFIARPHSSIICERSMSKWILRRAPIIDGQLANKCVFVSQ